MKYMYLFTVLVFSGSSLFAQFPRMQEKNPERFKDPNYKSYEDSLLQMNHFMTEIWEPEVVKVNPARFSPMRHPTPLSCSTEKIRTRNGSKRLLAPTVPWSTRK